MHNKEEYYCSFCKDEVCEFNENEFYRLDNEVYCSIYCYMDYRKDYEQKEEASFKTKKHNKANKNNKRQKKQVERRRTSK